MDSSRDPEITGWDADGVAYPAFRQTQGPQVFNMATPDITDEEDHATRATVAQHRIRAHQRPDISRWEDGNQAGHNRPSTTVTPEAQVSGRPVARWPTAEDVERGRIEAARKKARREKEHARHARARPKRPPA